MYRIYETSDFRTKMQAICRMDHLIRTSRKRRHSWPLEATKFKFVFNMADEACSVDGSCTSHVHVALAGGDASNGADDDVALTVDTQVNGCPHRRPFLIGVAGGTASGKVRRTGISKRKCIFALT